MNLVILTGIISLIPFAVSNDVVKLTDDNFEKKINGFPLVVVKFYAPWCGHCKKLEPEYEKAATELKSNDPVVTLAEMLENVAEDHSRAAGVWLLMLLLKLPSFIGQAPAFSSNESNFPQLDSCWSMAEDSNKVDCTKDGKQTCKKFDVNGYPTLKIFKYGRVSFDYEGSKETAENIVKYIKFKVDPGSQELKSLNELADYINSTDNVVIGFFHERRSSAIEKEFHKLAETQKENYKFAHTYSNKIMTTYGFRDDIALFRSTKLQTNLEQSYVKFEGELTLYQLRNWVTAVYHGLVGYRTMRNMEQFKAPFVVVYYDLDFVGQPMLTHYWRNRVMMVAKKYTTGIRKVTFAVSDAKEFQRELSSFGLNASDTKPLVAARDAMQQRFAYFNEFNIEGLEQFVQDFLDGALLPYIKSEPVPIVDDGLVKTVVGKTFDQIVNDHTKDVLVVLYAPWSSQCQTFIDILEKVAGKLIDDKNIVFAKMDATANEFSRPYVIKGYPSIYFAPKGMKSNPKLYEGNQEMKDVIRFLAQESTVPLKQYDRKGNKIKPGKQEKTDL